MLLVAYFARHPLALAVPEAGAFGLPQPGKLLGLARAVAIAVALNVAALGAGRALDARLSGPGAQDSCALPRALGLGFLVLVFAAPGLAASGLLEPWPILALLVLCAASGARQVAIDVRAARPSWGWLLVGAALLASPFLRAFANDPGWDALTYHLALPERMLFAGDLAVSPFSPYSTYPTATEMLYALGLALGSAPATTLLHLEFGALCAWVVYALAARTSRRAGVLAVGVALAIPVFWWELGVAYTDLSAAFYALLAAAALVSAVESQKEGEGRRAFLLCGLLAGAAAGTRYTVWLLPPALMLALWLPPRFGSAKDRARAAVAIAVGSVVAVSPWLVRNALTTGNPFSPLLEGWVGEAYFPPVVSAQMAANARTFGMGRGPLDLLALPWNLTMRAQAGDYGAFHFLIGPMPLLGAVAVLAAGRRARPAYVATLLWVAALLALGWFYTFQEPRFLLPALLLLAVGAGAAAEELIPRTGPGRAWLALPVVAVLAVQLPSLALLPRHYGRGLGPLEPSEAERRASDVAGERLRATLAPDDRVLLLFEPRSFDFRGLDYLPWSPAEGAPALHLVHDAGGADPLRARLEALGVTHVVVNQRLLGALPPEFVAGYTRADFEGDLRTLEDFLIRHTQPLFAVRDLAVRAIR